MVKVGYPIDPRLQVQDQDAFYIPAIPQPTVPIGLLLWTGMVCTAFLTLAPMLVGALVEQGGLSARQAGLVASIQLVGSAVGTSLVLARGRTWSLRGSLLMATAILCASDVVSALVHSLVPLGLCRLVAGAAAGVAFAVVNAAAARLPRPGVMFAALAVVQMLFGIVGFLGLPFVLEFLGLRGAFLALASCSLPCILCAPRLPADPAVLHPARCASRSLAPQGGLLLASLFATYLANTAVWTYLERIGIAAGLAPRAVSMGLALGTLGGLAGALAAALLARRRAQIPYVLVAPLALLTVSTALLLRDVSAISYFGALLGLNAAFMMATPLFLARLADSKFGDGHVVVALSVMYLGLIGGPALGASLVSPVEGYQALIAVAGGLFLTAAGLAYAAARGGPAAGTQLLDPEA